MKQDNSFKNTRLFLDLLNNQSTKIAENIDDKIQVNLKDYESLLELSERKEIDFS